jgi:glycine/D-amino acid oxidase-like deaminating enzyme
MQAPAVGLLLAQEITGSGSDIDLSPFRPDRFANGQSTPETAII